MTIFNSPTDVVVECPADGRMDGLVAQTHHCNNTGVMDLTAARNVQVDPSAPGGYSKKSLALEEKQRLFPDFSYGKTMCIKRNSYIIKKKL